MMIPLLAAVLLIGSRLHARYIGAATAAATVLSYVPLMAFPLTAVGGFYALYRRVRLRGTQRLRRRQDTALLADLTALGLTGGMGILPALEVAAGAVGGDIAAEVDVLLRRARVEGIGAAMSGAGGAGRELYRVLGRATDTGAALLEQVTRVADEMYAEMAAQQLERVRKLPVAMLFPLTLLILPGFLLLTVVPAVLDALFHLDP